MSTMSGSAAGEIEDLRARLVHAEARTAAADRGWRIAESHLALLRAQVDPDFIYNTLASLKYLMHKDSEAADKLLTHLITYLRRAMPKQGEAVSQLGKEFELAEAFLQIAAVRMGGRLKVAVELAEELQGTPFPALVMQTLVANALRHGVEPKVGEVWIKISAERSADQLKLTVSDNGVGLGMAPAATSGSGAGLQNIRRRLLGIYGTGAVLTVSGRREGGTAATVQVPVTMP